VPSAAQLRDELGIADERNACSPDCYLSNPVHDLPPAARAALDRGYVQSGLFVLGGALGRLTGWAVARLGFAASRVWALSPFARGVAIESALGRNLPANFPVIDRFANGVATSIKSIDLAAESYQNASTLTRTVVGYIDKVAAFGGRTWGGAAVRGADITGRALELAVPAGGGTAAQQAALQSAVEYGESIGVSVHVIPF
jgi:hypothetical protein